VANDALTESAREGENSSHVFGLWWIGIMVSSVLKLWEGTYDSCRFLRFCRDIKTNRKYLANTISKFR
jgi:hypothetical protein